MKTAALLAAALVLGTVSCARRPPDPAAVADGITRGVYADDYAVTVAPFDAQNKAEVTPARLAQLSARMRSLGAYQGLTPASTDPQRGLYEYDARFSHGHMTVWMRLDPGGEVGGYRVDPGPPG